MKASIAVFVLSLFVCGQAMAQTFGDRIESSKTSAEEQRAQKVAEIPKCDRPVGTVAIALPEKNWWTQAQVQSPDGLIKFFAMKSNCFTVIDRGRGFEIAARERALAAGGQLQEGSNIGGKQMKAADYVITPDIVSSNQNAGGNMIGAILGGFLPGPLGLIAGNVSINDKSANVTLAVTDVRTSEQVIMAEGKAQKTDIGFGVGAGGFMGGGFGAAGIGSYENTAQGQVVALAYLDAYTQMVAAIQKLPPPAPVATAATQPAVTEQPQVVAVAAPAPAPVAAKKLAATINEGRLLQGPSDKSQLIKKVPPGTIFNLTERKIGPWVEVEDDGGGRGWMTSTNLQFGQ